MNIKSYILSFTAIFVTTTLSLSGIAAVLKDRIENAQSKAEITTIIQGIKGSISYYTAELRRAEKRLESFSSQNSCEQYLKTARQQVARKCKTYAEEYKCSINNKCQKKAQMYGPTAEEDFDICVTVTNPSITEPLKGSNCPWTLSSLLGDQISISHYFKD